MCVGCAHHMPTHGPLLVYASSWHAEDGVDLACGGWGRPCMHHDVQGEDFSAIVGIPEVDIGSVHIYLEGYPICTE